MTDGDSRIPQAAINRHINCTTFKDKIDFYAVGFGNVSNNLK